MIMNKTIKDREWNDAGPSPIIQAHNDAKVLYFHIYWIGLFGLIFKIRFCRILFRNYAWDKKKHPSFSSSINLVSTNSFQNFEGTSISFFLKNGLVSKKFWKTIFEGTVNQTSFSVISGNESRKQKTESKSDTKQQKPMYKLHRQKSEKSKRRNARNLKIESVINFLHFCYTGWIVFSIVLLQTCTSNRSPQWKAITA